MIRHANRDVMVREICQAGQIGTEIGVFEGDFSETLLSTNPGWLYLIDYWRQQQGDYVVDGCNGAVSDDVYLRVINKFIQYPNVVTLRLLSEDAVKHFPDEYFDWIYIDADHTYKAIKKDLELWMPKIKLGGVLMGHDYIMTSWIQVQQAVDEFLNGRELDFLTEDEIPSWGIIKTKKKGLLYL